MGQQQVDQQQIRVIAAVVNSTFTSICDIWYGEHSSSAVSACDLENK